MFEWNIHEVIEELNNGFVNVKYAYVNSDKTLLPIKFFGYQYVVDINLSKTNDIPSDDIVRSFYGFANERRSRNMVLPILRPNDVFIDVGACIGSWTIPAAVMGARVIAYEANPDAAVILESIAEMNSIRDRIALYNQYIAADKNNPIDSQNIGNVKLIKIDVEGAELEVLKGASETIRRYKPYILVEVHTNTSPEFEIALVNSICPDTYKHHTVSQRLFDTDAPCYHVYHYK